jgi:3-oxoadipate enol-lactonase
MRPATFGAGMACIVIAIVAGARSKAPKPAGDASQAVSRTGFVQAKGASLYYEDVGTGEPVILLHSSLTNLHIWDAQAKAMADRYRVIRYDARGFGRSRGDSVPFTDYDDLLAVMDQLALGKAILVGLSLGGMTAIEFALEHPERVTALVLAGTGLNGYEYSFSDEDLERFAATRKAAADGDVNTAAALSTKGYFDAPERPWTRVDSTLRATVHDMILGSGNRRALDAANLHHFLEPPAIGRLGELRGPVLLILGEYESANERAIADLIERNVPRVQRAILPGASHLTSMENPEAFNDALMDFIASSSLMPASQ